MLCARGRLAQALVLVLAVALVVVSVQYVKPEPAHAVEPVTIVLGAGIVLTVAAMVGLIVAANRYPDGMTYKQHMDAVGATVPQGLVVQAMLDKAVGAAVIATAYLPQITAVLRDGRLCRAAISWIKGIPGAWDRIKSSADNATTVGGKTYANVGESWDDLGFSGTADPIAGASFEETGGFASGGVPAGIDAAGIAAGFMYTYWDNVGSTNHVVSLNASDTGREWDVITAIEVAAESGGSILQWNNGSRFIVNSTTFGNWYSGVSPATDNMVKCGYCGATQAASYGALSMYFQRRLVINPPPGGSHYEHGINQAQVGAGNIAVNHFILQHAVDNVCVQSTDDLEARIDRLAQGDTVTYNVTNVTNITNGGTYDPGSTTSNPPVDPTTGNPTAPTIPEYAPASLTWGIGVNQTMLDWAEDFHNFADTLTAGATALEGTTADWPDVARFLVNWLLSPFQLFLQAAAAACDFFGLIIEWVAPFFASIANVLEKFGTWLLVEIARIASAVGSAIGSFIGSVSDALSSWWEIARAWFGEQVDVLVDAFTGAWEWVASAVTTVPQWAQDVWDTITAPAGAALADLTGVLWPFEALDEAGGGSGGIGGGGGGAD